MSGYNKLLSVVNEVVKKDFSLQNGGALCQKKKILDKIEKSAAQEKIPESIEPEQIKKKLKGEPEKQGKTEKGSLITGL